MFEKQQNMMTKKKKVFIIIFSVIFGIALGAAGFVAYKQYFKKENEQKSNNTKTPSVSKTIANTLDGTLVSSDLANRYPLAVIIENHTQARPQVGLDKAAIVYEALAEGGITRFMAIYGPHEATKIGPVRSVRTYFLDWLAEYNAYISHVGGNIDALDRIQPENIFDLDQFSLGETAYWREPEAGKAIEHTMFTDLDKLYKAATEKYKNIKSKFTTFKFLDIKKDIDIDKTTTQEITIDFSAPSYKVSYTYDPGNNVYLRSMAGTAHKDKATGNQLAPTNIIIQAVPKEDILTRINETGLKMATIGEGKAIVLYGNKKIDATWKKNDLKSRTLFYDTQGNEIKFLPGQFWYEIVPPDVFEKVVIEDHTPETITE